ncbi:hypothetical protein EVAR_3407_1 [Eumeta japonica]|uniref:Uncharacterized protein n=1 Tax=Eumeta variegata TaxID=151549 RepID=A0A4C1SV22_EUMVA|nr:hypothetical protein EVAR_3407_1 [Eumeta japonica]
MYSVPLQGLFFDATQAERIRRAVLREPEPTEKQSKNATAQEIAKYTALAKADRKINPYEWWALSTNKNGFPILKQHRLGAGQERRGGLARDDTAGDVHGFVTSN